MTERLEDRLEAACSAVDWRELRPLLRQAASEIRRLREGLGPFARAVEDADDKGVRDTVAAWESPMAMAVSYGDFRRAALLHQGGEK